MSSFKRKGSATGGGSGRQSLPPGTRSSSNVSSVPYLSTGIASLDDVLGGGIPLGSVLIVLAPDLHSAWGTLIQRYFAAQGIALGQQVAVLGDEEDAANFVNGCMWLPPSKDSADTSGTSASGSGAQKSSKADEEDEEAADSDAKIKIAWRYEKMQQFQTTIASSSSSSDGYCDTFDLTTRIPESVVDAAKKASLLKIISAEGPLGNVFHTYIKALKSFIAKAKGRNTTRQAMRLSVPDLGSPSWGDPTPQTILSFINSLRTTIRSTDIAALVTLPPHLCVESPVFPSSPGASASHGSTPTAGHWHQKISFLTDGCILLTSFGADPALAPLFKSYHGALRVLRSPTLHTLLPASHKHSILRGLRPSSTTSHSSSSSSMSMGTADSTGTGENNLAFRCTRKRFVIETLHLDAEGGVGERRTSAPPSAVTQAHAHGHGADHSHKHVHAASSGPASIAIELPANPPSGETQNTSTSTPLSPSTDPSSPPPAKPRKSAMKNKRVAFQSDRPDLYDF
ncbi:PAXNEB-domain-containing protein [Clavulina sp. PMI_390]|nr:PAXNEB-domain-containing protein [Clavulina sp. PMI_390]